MTWLIRGKRRGGRPVGGLLSGLTGHNSVGVDAVWGHGPKVAAAAATVWLGSTWMISMLNGFMHKAFIAIPWIVQR